MPADSTTTDVVIVGCGPVGATLAIALRHHGLDVVVLEKQPDIYHLPRAVSMDDEIRRMYQSWGMRETVDPMVTPLLGAEFVDVEGNRLLGFDLPEGTVTANGYPPMSMHYQPELDAMLRAEVIGRGAELRVSCPVASVTDTTDGVRAETEAGEVVEARWAVACDGAGSPTRAGRGIGVTDLGFDQEWVVIDIEIDGGVGDLRGPAQQICDPARPGTFVPGHARWRRWEFQMQPGETREEMESPEKVWELVAPWLTPEEGTLVRAVVYRFHAMVAERMRDGNLFLAGDCAHQMPPFLGQGMNSGQRDAANLAWKMAFVHRGRAGDALLDTYGIERMPHAKGVVEHAADVGRLIDQLAGRVSHGVDESAGYGGDRPFPKLEEGALVGDADLVGRLAPQLVVDGVYSDADLSDGFDVLVADPALNVPPQWAAMGARGHRVGEERTGGHGAIVVRPDRYVAMVADSQNEMNRSTGELLRRMGISV